MLSTSVLKLCYENNISPDAVVLILEGLRRATRPNIKHISGQALCETIKEMTLTAYGPLGKTVLETYGIHSTKDIGHLVFKLIECKILSQSDDDCLEDFDNVYDIEEIFSMKKYVEALPL